MEFHQASQLTQFLIAPAAAHEEIISSIRWDETGRLLVSASNDGFVNVWDMNKQARIVKNFSPGHPSGIYWYAPSKIYFFLIRR